MNSLEDARVRGYNDAIKLAFAQQLASGLSTVAGLASMVPGIGTAGGAALGAIGGAAQGYANGEGVKGMLSRGALGGAAGAIPGHGLVKGMGALGQGVVQAGASAGASMLGDHMNKPPLQPYGK